MHAHGSYLSPQCFWTVNPTLAWVSDFASGDKPELQYPEARSELQQMGHETTLEYVAAAAAMVTRETGLLPHINAGTMGLAEVWCPLRIVSYVGMFRLVTR